MRGRGIWAALALALAGCGYPGDPLPPALNIPERVEDLRALQRGGRILVQFTAPRMTTDKLALKSLPPMELHAGRRGEGEFNTEAWAASAEILTMEPGEKTEVTLELPARQWARGEVVLGVRAVGPTGRRSGWSNLVALWVLPPLSRPEGLRGRATAEGVLLEWDAGEGPDGRGWRVFRKGADEQGFILLGTAAEASWLDRGIVYGRRYAYVLQAVAPAGESQAESEPGAPFAIEPRDTFPPAPPLGLTGIAGVNSIELAWERSPEEDLAGYQVWRAEGDGEFARLGDPVSTLSFSDSDLVSGRRYRYAIAALDLAGNESARSEAVEITAP